MRKDIDKLSPEARSIIRAQVTRRSLLVGAGAIAGASTLAACGTGSTDSGAEGVVDVSDSEKIVRWANWPLYLDYNEDSKEYPTLKAFEAATGISATYTEDIDDNNTFYGKVQGQLGIGTDIGYDVVTPTDWMAARWIELGYAQELDAANIPNKSNIREVLSNVGFDPGRNYSLTWQSGFAGFGWNTEKLPKGVRTIEDLFAPANKGRVVVLSELRDTIGIILQYQGVDPSSDFTEDQYMNAIDFLKGKVIGWSGDMFILKSENDGKFDFAIPESGGTLWSDNMLVPSTSTHKKNAELLMNHYYDPAIAAQVAAYVNYICPVEAAQSELEKIDPDLAASPFIFPDEATLAKVKVFRSLDADESTNFQAAFDEAVGN
jgi:spermidine/putrescine transport system substrate-binding protein